MQLDTFFSFVFKGLGTNNGHEIKKLTDTGLWWFFKGSWTFYKNLLTDFKDNDCLDSLSVSDFIDIAINQLLVQK